MSEASAAPFRSGFVALVGRPNAGKSTLVNACVGEKVAIASPVAQTTRRRMRGIVTTPTCQIVLVDTPGLHKPKDTLGDELNRSALSELGDVDVVAMLVDATKPVGTGDEWVARHVDAADAVKVLVLTKADKADAPMMQRQLEAATKLAAFDEVIVISAVEGFNVDGFLALVESHLPEGPKWFPEDMRCDASDEMLVAEFVREKVLLNTKEEVPHSVGVICDDIEFKKNVVTMSATIYVERESQKGIVVGKGGSMVKRIGIDARRDLERIFGSPVFLSLDVRVKRDWRRDASQIRRFGYDARAGE